MKRRDLGREEGSLQRKRDRESDGYVILKACNVVNLKIHDASDNGIFHCKIRERKRSTSEERKSATNKGLCMSWAWCDQWAHRSALARSAGSDG
nr:hypothetical protein Iba_chr05aCG15240 [Ipomoea batatas]GMD02093.1 hypothetical protein Iba_chr05fCG13340 [Ipomoea batatas]